MVVLAAVAANVLWIRQQPTAADACAQSPSPTPVSSIYVSPDDGYPPVLDEITQARCTIDLNMYLLSDDTIIAALVDAVERGVDVRVILERSPFNSFGGEVEIHTALTDAGVDVRWEQDRFQYSHAKYMVVDSRVLVVTNQNFTYAGFNDNREFGVVTTVPETVAQAAAVFDADWHGRETVEGLGSLVVSPDNARGRIIELINRARESVWLYAEVLRDDQVLRALDEAVARGCEVRVLVNPTADEDDAPYLLDAIGHGVRVRALEQPYVHAKVMIVDGERALIGSHNYSSTSLDLNREVSVIVEDADLVGRVVDVYAADWRRAYPVERVTLSLTHLMLVGSIASGRWGVV